MLRYVSAAQAMFHVFSGMVCYGMRLTREIYRGREREERKGQVGKGKVKDNLDPISTDQHKFLT